MIFAFKILSQLNEPSFKGIVDNHCLADYVLCIVEFAESVSVVQIKYHYINPAYLQ